VVAVATVIGRHHWPDQLGKMVYVAGVVGGGIQMTDKCPRCGRPLEYESLPGPILIQKACQCGMPEKIITGKSQMNKARVER